MREFGRARQQGMGGDVEGGVRWGWDDVGGGWEVHMECAYGMHEEQCGLAGRVRVDCRCASRVCGLGFLLG